MYMHWATICAMYISMYVCTYAIGWFYFQKTSPSFQTSFVQIYRWYIDLPHRNHSKRLSGLYSKYEMPGIRIVDPRRDKLPIFQTRRTLLAEAAYERAGTHPVHERRPFCTLCHWGVSPESSFSLFLRSKLSARVTWWVREKWPKT
jgi:hypothetical protein